MLNIKQKVLFVQGKGGVGRTILTSSLGYYYAKKGLKTLLIQWTIKDSISPLFNQELVGHKHKEIFPNLYVMNYDPKITLYEYFVDHLNMKFFYNFVLENKQVKKLIQIAPGLEEIFFLGRIFWLVDLAKEERGYEFDKIIIDSPATGHGSALFGVISTISNFQWEGPLIFETTRVSRMLSDENKVGILLISLPEELPYEETIELNEVITKEMKRSPIILFINKSISGYIHNDKFEDHPPFLDFFKKNYNVAYSLYNELKNKLEYEKKIKNYFQDKVNKIFTIPDIHIKYPEISGLEKIIKISEFFEQHYF